MTERQIINLIESTLYKKIEQNEEFIKYSFYEVNVKFPLKNEEERLTSRSGGVFIAISDYILNQNRNYNLKCFSEFL